MSLRGKIRLRGDLCKVNLWSGSSEIHSSSPQRGDHREGLGANRAVCICVCAFTDVRNYDYDNTLQ